MVDVTSVAISRFALSPHVVTLIANNLAESIVLGPVLGERPLEGSEGGVVDLNVLLSEFFDRLVLAVTDHTVLEGGEHGCADVLVVHGLSGGVEEASGQHLAGLNSNRR